MRKNLFTFMFSFLFAHFSFCQYEQHYVLPIIHSVQLHQQNKPMSNAIIELNTNEKLELSFDTFDEQPKDYQYTFIHCDANWQKSDISPQDYLNGFFTDDIVNYDFSRNTLQPYIHYQLIFPTEDMTPKLGGNYLIKVFESGNPDEVVIMQSFRILDSKVNITADAKGTLLTRMKTTKQEVDFTIDVGRLNVYNPNQNIKVVVQQNHRSDNQLSNLRPKEIRNNIWDYHYDDETTFFNGGNEFRYFDIKSLHYSSERINKIKHQDTVHIELFPEINRAFKEYIYYNDLDGNSFLKTEDQQDSSLESEYVLVKFSFPVQFPYLDGEIYIFGDFTQRKFSKQNQMIYNPDMKAYELELFLKQGYYHYFLAYVNNKNQVPDILFFEGNFAETNNLYSIYVYYRERGTYYDNLVGLMHLRAE